MLLSRTPPYLLHPFYSNHQYRQYQQEEQYYSPHYYYKNNHATAAASLSYNNVTTKHHKYDNTPSSYHASAYNQYNYHQTAARYNGDSVGGIGSVGSSDGGRQQQYPYGYKAPQLPTSVAAAYYHHQQGRSYVYLSIT